jgi:hypothetical protein
MKQEKRRSTDAYTLVLTKRDKYSAVLQGVIGSLKCWNLTVPLPEH